MTVYAIVADSTAFEIDRLPMEQFCRLIPTEGYPHRGPCMVRSVRIPCCEGPWRKCFPVDGIIFCTNCKWFCKSYSVNNCNQLITGVLWDMSSSSSLNPVKSSWTGMRKLVSHFQMQIGKNLPEFTHFSSNQVPWSVWIWQDIIYPFNDLYQKCITCFALSIPISRSPGPLFWTAGGREMITKT